MFAINERMVAILGRYHIHIYPLSHHYTLPNQGDGSMPIPPGHTHLTLPSAALSEKVSTLCVEVSDDGRYIAVADSMKNVYLYGLVEEPQHTWELISQWTMDRRLTCLAFDKKTMYIVMNDKNGEVWISLIGSKVISNPKRILGHTGAILDLVLTQDNTRILTSDRDTHIRVSNFPFAFQIATYHLAHTEAVVAINLVNTDRHLLSVSQEGVLKLWGFGGAENDDPEGSWDLWGFLDKRDPTRTPDGHEVLKMKSVDLEGRIYCAVVFAAMREMPVFELLMIDDSKPAFRLFGVCRCEEDLVGVAWVRDHLYLFSPETAGFKRYYVKTRGGLILDDSFSLPLSHQVHKDFEAYWSFNRPTSGVLIPVGGVKRIGGKDEMTRSYVDAEVGVGPSTGHGRPLPTTAEAEMNDIRQERLAAQGKVTDEMKKNKLREITKKLLAEVSEKVKIASVVGEKKEVKGHYTHTLVSRPRQMPNIPMMSTFAPRMMESKRGYLRAGSATYSQRAVYKNPVKAPLFKFGKQPGRKELPSPNVEEVKELFGFRPLRDPRDIEPTPSPPGDVYPRDPLLKNLAQVSQMIKEKEKARLKKERAMVKGPFGLVGTREKVVEEIFGHFPPRNLGEKEAVAHIISPRSARALPSPVKHNHPKIVTHFFKEPAEH